MDAVAPKESRSCSNPIPAVVSPHAVLEFHHFPVTLTRVSDRLYLASYLVAPTANTYFPYPDPALQLSPSKRSQKAGQGPSATPAVAAKPRNPPYYFSVDESLPYNPFHHDFGPLHIGHLYRFALTFHDILAATENQDRPIVFWSKADSRSKFRVNCNYNPSCADKVSPSGRANAACLLACYMVLIQSWPPHLALAPISQVDPPLMPFRDAGYSQADYGITVQDVVYGVWKAKEQTCCVLDSFDLEEYETYERVENGDFNWITPFFVAFASPTSKPVDKITDESQLAALPRTEKAIDAHEGISPPFKKVLKHFTDKKVGLVVRLNDPLYSPSFFEAIGIKHVDMIFDDGTCPSLQVVRRFIRMAHETINGRKKCIAVHCKAGLGRTGCLIGAYLIYRYGFTANEIIAYMRFMRPGMVVGPQQHWLHINQGVFREWRLEDKIERRLRREMMEKAAQAAPPPSTPIRAMQKTSIMSSRATVATTSTPPPQQQQHHSFRGEHNRTPLSEMDLERNANGATAAAAVAAQDDYLPAPTPGQPRKTARHPPYHPYQRSPGHATTPDDMPQPDTVSVHHHHHHHRHTSRAGGGNSTESSDEELILRMQRSQQRQQQQQQQQQQASSPSRKPSSDRLRSTSATVTTITTTTAVYTRQQQQQDAAAEKLMEDALYDVENLPAPGTAKQQPGTTTAVYYASAASSASPSRNTSGAGALSVGKVRGHATTGPSSPGRRVPSTTAGGVRKASGRIGSAGGPSVAAAVAAAVAKRVEV